MQRSENKVPQQGNKSNVEKLRVKWQAFATSLLRGFYLVIPGVVSSFVLPLCSHLIRIVFQCSVFYFI